MQLNKNTQKIILCHLYFASHNLFILVPYLYFIYYLFTICAGIRVATISGKEKNRLLLNGEQRSLAEDLLEDGSAAVVFRSLPLQVNISFGHGVDGEGVRWSRSR